jgi:hypothetical protein
MQYDRIGLEDLLRLAEAKGGERVSIYIPVETAGPSTRENPIRFKNAVREAEALLIPQMHRAEEARRLLDPIRDLENDRVFWENQGRGFAAFVDAEGASTFRLPFEAPELVSASSVFHLKPLLPFFTESASYFVLDLNLNHVRLYRADKNDIDEVIVPELPSSLGDALWPDQWQDQQQFHTTSAGVGERGTVVTHSSGDEGQDRRKEDILRFFQMIDAALMPMLAEERRPLVVACVPYLKPLYDEANSYANLLEETATQDPEASSPVDLAGRSWPIVRSYLEAREQHDRERYGDQLSSGRAVSAIDRVVAAAIEGRVDTLWVSMQDEVWGRIDEVTNVITVHEPRQSGDFDLLDRAAIQALAAGGRLYTVDRERAPDGSVAAAILRY